MGTCGCVNGGYTRLEDLKGFTRFQELQERFTIFTRDHKGYKSICDTRD